MAVSFLQSAVSGTDLTTYTFSSQNFGTASATRHIIAAVNCRASAAITLSSVTIGGVSATIVANAVNGAGGNTTISALAIAAVPTGTSGDVVVVLSGGALRCGIGLYAATDILSATATDSGISTAAAPTFNIDVTANGFAIGNSYNGDTSTATWTGITEDYDEAVEGAGSAHSGASATFGTTQTDLTLTCTWTAPATPAGAFASWAPAVPSTSDFFSII